MGHLTLDIALYRSARVSRHHESVITLDTLVAGIRSGVWRQQTDEYRAAMPLLTPAALSGKKSSLFPAFTPTGVQDTATDHGRCSSNPHSNRCSLGQYRREATSPFVSRTGFVALDVDAYKDADALDATAIRDAIAATPYCAAAFISASGKGVKAVIRVEPVPQTPLEHRHAWDAAWLRMLNELSMEASSGAKDPPGSSISHLQFVSFDPDAYVNTEAEALHWEPPVEAPKAERESKYSYTVEEPQPLKPTAYSEQQVREMLEYCDPDGSWGDFRFKICRALRNWDSGGELGRSVWMEFAQRATRSPHDIDYVRSYDEAEGAGDTITVGTLVYHAKEGGCPWLQERQTIRANATDYEGALRKVGLLYGAELEYCMESRTGRPLVRVRPGGDARFLNTLQPRPMTWADVYPDGWRALDDGLMQKLASLVTRHYIFTNGKTPSDTEFAMFKAAMRIVRAEHAIDFFEMWLDGLPVWDGQSRLDEIFITVMGAADTPLVRAAARIVYIGAVARTLQLNDLDSKHDETPVLVGEQGTGKSTFVQHALPRELRMMYYAGSLPLDGSAQEKLEAIGAAVLVEMGDLSGLNKADINKTKAWLSQTSDTYRRPYDVSTTTTARRWVAVGTVNPSSNGFLPSDPTGNRRWLPVDVSPPGTMQDVVKWWDENREQLWAEALHRYKTGARHYLSAEESASRNVHNREYVSVDDSTEEAYGKFLEWYLANAKGQVVSMKDMLAHTDLLFDDKRAQKAFGGYLRTQGWRKKQLGVRKAWLWQPPDDIEPHESDDRKADTTAEAAAGAEVERVRREQEDARVNEVQPLPERWYCHSAEAYVQAEHLGHEGTLCGCTRAHWAAQGLPDEPRPGVHPKQEGATQ